MAEENTKSVISETQYLNLQLVKRYVTPLMNQLDGLDYHIFGGFIRDVYMGRTPNDIDMGVDGEESLELIGERLQDIGYVVELSTPYGYKFRYLNTLIDLQAQTLTPVEEKLMVVDFTINALGFTAESELIFHRTTLDDIDNKLLKEFTNSNQSTITQRTSKFYARGFTHQDEIEPVTELHLHSVYIDDLPWAEREFDLRK